MGGWEVGREGGRACESERAGGWEVGWEGGRACERESVREPYRERVVWEGSCSNGPHLFVTPHEFAQAGSDDRRRRHKRNPTGGHLGGRRADQLRATQTHKHTHQWGRGW